MIKRKILGTDANIKYKFPWRKKNTDGIEDYTRRKMIKTQEKSERKKNHKRMYTVCIQSELAVFLLARAKGERWNSGSLQGPSASSWVSNHLVCLGHTE